MLNHMVQYNAPIGGMQGEAERQSEGKYNQEGYTEALAKLIAASESKREIEIQVGDRRREPSRKCLDSL
jgi:hypothetical protein